MPPPRGTPFKIEAEDLQISDDESHITARGVTITYPDRATGGNFVMTANEAIVDNTSRVATLRGNVVLTTPQGLRVTGDEMSLNLRTREWTLRTGRTEFTPEMLQNGVLGSIFAQATSVAGERGHVRMEGSAFTTCDLTRPHYHFRARSVDVYPGDRMIVRRATLFALGQRLFTLPTLVIPLRERAQRRFPIVPEVGQNESEGIFVKAAYQYALKDDQPGLLKLDLLQKRGIGTGIEQAYRIGGGVGSLLLYNLIPRAGIAAERSGHFQHSQQFGNIRADVSGDFRRSDYQYSVAEGVSSTTTNAGLTLNRQVQGMSTTLNLRQDETQGFGTFRTLASSLTHQQQFSPGLTGNFGADYISSTSGGGGVSSLVSRQLNSRMELRRQQRQYDLILNANDSTDLSESGAQTRSGLERLPELSLLTSSDRFWGGPFSRALPLRLLFSMGRFHEEPGAVDTERALLQLELTQKRIERGSHALVLNGMFRQSFYGDGGAQYVVSGNNRYSLQLGSESEFNLTHIFQSPKGFTPFRFDFPYRQNRLESNLLIAKGERFDVGFRTGYDFRAPEQFRWQNITMRLRWLPTPNSLFFLGTSYNPNPLGLPTTSPVRQSRFQTVVSQFRVRVPDGLKLDVGLRYDPARSSFTAAKMAIDTKIGRKWHFAGLFGYDGFTRFNDFMIIRDLHCWELSLVRTDHRDWRREQGWRINLSIKAFPVFQRFGVGESGQSLDTSVGDVF